MLFIAIEAPEISRGPEVLIGLFKIIFPIAIKEIAFVEVLEKLALKFIELAEIVKGAELTNANISEALIVTIFPFIVIKPLL